MARIEVTVDVPHLTTDGNEEPHVLQLKLDGIDAGPAWRRVNALIGVFLDAEEEAQRIVDRQVQAVEGPWCDHAAVFKNVGYHCNLPPDHRTPHENFQTGRTWPIEPWQPREEQCA